MKIALILSLLVAIIFAQTTIKRRASCSFDNFDNINLISGRVDITYDGQLTTFDVQLTGNLTEVLPDDNNTIHIHQVGLDGTSTSCLNTLKHYNPIINYGELAAVYGFIPQTGTHKFTSNTVKLEGSYNILGRSLVVHNSTGQRIGCCTIVLTEDKITSPVSGYSQSVFRCNMSGASYALYYDNIEDQFFLNLTVANIRLYPNLTNNVIRIHENGNCTIGNYGPVYSKVTLPNFNNNNVINQKLLLNIGYMDMGMMGDLYDIGGRIIVRYDPAFNGPVDCCVLVQMSYQTNINDGYVPVNTVSKPPSTESSSSSFVFASLLLILAVIF